MTTHNQAGSDCYYCCGKCRRNSDCFRRDTIEPNWSDPIGLGAPTWTIDSNNLYAASDAERHVVWDPTDGVWYSRVFHFDVHCATNGGTFECRFGSMRFGFQFGTGSELIISEGTAYRWHETLSLSTSTWYRIKFKVSAITATFAQCTIYIDDVELGTYRHMSFGAATGGANVRFVNRRTFSRTAGTEVDTYTPAGSTTGALSEIRIRRVCLNNLQYPDWLGNEPGRRKFCDAPVNSLNITDGLADSVELTISGSADAEIDGTYTLALSANSNFVSNIIGSGATWYGGWAAGTYTITNAGFTWSILGLEAGFRNESVYFAARLQMTSPVTRTATAVWRDDTQPTALPFSRDYSDMEYVYFLNISGPASYAGMFGTGIDFAIAVP